MKIFSRSYCYMIGSWHHNACLSVCPSVTLFIVALKVGVDG